MNTFEELNNFGSTPIDYLDLRPSGVRFNREFPLTGVDQVLTIINPVVTPSTGLEIEEIINYQTANVRYRVNIVTGTATPLVNSSISWNSLPSSVTLTQSGNVYTLSGITDVSIWQQVKNFVWTLPTNYASYPLWFLNVQIVYFDSAANSEIVKNWLVYDDRFFYVNQMRATSRITIRSSVNRPAAASLTASATIAADAFNRIQFNAQLTAGASISAEGLLTGVALLRSSSTMSVVIGVSSPATVSLNATCTASGNLLGQALNLDPRSYGTNRYTQLFATNTPIVDSANDNDTISVTLTSSIGRWSTDITSVPSSSLTLTGTKSQINADIINVWFWPNRGASGVSSFTWEQKVNTVTVFTRSIALNSFIAGFMPVTYSFVNPGAHTWTPTYAEAYYGGYVDVALVGGGGGGGAFAGFPSTTGGSGGFGGGGGGGQVKDVYTIPIAIGSSYSLYVGAGGGIGGAGESTTAFGQTANRGQGGSSYSRVETRQGVTNRGGTGGTSGSGVAGGLGVTSDYSLTAAGGVGGGAGGNANLGTSAGLRSNILNNGVRYGSGGAGGEFTRPSAPAVGGGGGGWGAAVGNGGLIFFRVHA
jgi:hypothetical protein